jgi:hypothetical protein
MRYPSCAGQRVNQEAVSPSGVRMKGRCIQTQDSHGRQPAEANLRCHDLVESEIFECGENISASAHSAKILLLTLFP